MEVANLRISGRHPGQSAALCLCGLVQSVAGRHAPVTRSAADGCATPMSTSEPPVTPQAAAGDVGKSAIMIVPQFLAAVDVDAYRLPADTLRWTLEGWEAGDPALAPTPASSSRGTRRHPDQIGGSKPVPEPQASRGGRPFRRRSGRATLRDRGERRAGADAASVACVMSDRRIRRPMRVRREAGHRSRRSCPGYDHVGNSAWRRSPPSGRGRSNCGT